MKGLVYILLVLSAIMILLALLCKFITWPNMVAGIGQRGYLAFSVIVLLFSANIALLELLKKK